MRGARNFPLNGAAIAAVGVVTLTFSLQIAAVSAQQQDTSPRPASQRIALYIRLCLWSEHRPTETCHYVPLTPGAGGAAFIDMQSCQDGQDEAMRKWREQAGPVFGFTAMAGDGYRIDGMHCSPVESE
ncbi:MAG TPA: hypothetical protein VGM32_19965 [Rhodopila sp.]|jgi:hypothetical protein